MRTLAQRFGIVVRALRNEAGLSQEDFAGRCGLHRTYIGSIERGEKSITIDTAQKLADAFAISLTELFQRLEAMQQESNVETGDKGEHGQC